MVLLGLMLLALVIAAIVHDDGTEATSPAAQSPTPTGSTTSTPTGGASGQGVIDQINATLKTGAGLVFVVGKSDLAPASSATLDKVVALLQKNPTVKADVRGYTDDQGDALKNQQLSLARAQSVVDYLKSKGVGPERLTANGFGEANPIESNDTEAGRAKNRRVEFALA